MIATFICLLTTFFSAISYCWYCLFSPYLSVRKNNIFFTYACIDYYSRLCVALQINGLTRVTGVTLQYNYAHARVIRWLAITNVHSDLVQGYKFENTGKQQYKLIQVHKRSLKF